jgi:hypothetical protein
MTSENQAQKLQDPTATPDVRAWCVGPDAFYPDYLVCSGKFCAELRGMPCPRSEGGRMPRPKPLNEDDPLYSIDKGQPGDLCPSCCESQLTNLAHWEGHGRQIFPEKLLPLRLFKCSVVGALCLDSSILLRQKSCKILIQTRHKGSTTAYSQSARSNRQRASPALCC